MAAPRSEIADLIARYCTQLGEMSIRVERALLFGSYARGAEREGSDIDVLIVSSDFSVLNARERLEYLGTAAARLWQPIEALPAPQTNWHTPNLPRFWRKSYGRGCVSHRRFACVQVCPCRGDGGSEAYDPSVSTPHPRGHLAVGGTAGLRGTNRQGHGLAAMALRCSGGVRVQAACERAG